MDQNKTNGSNILKTSIQDAKERIYERISIGKQMLTITVNTQSQYDELVADYRKWKEYNLMMLKNIFSDEDIINDYNRSSRMPISTSSIQRKIKSLENRIREDIISLESIHDRLVFFKEPIESNINLTVNELTVPGEKTHKSVFIGHGRSQLWAIVKSHLHGDYGVDSFVFESDSHTGEQIIDILEGFLNKADFAILILTAEDETLDGNIRARQNVIHEAGLFQGRLGFRKAILLRQNGLENFTNVDGLQYIGFSDNQIQQTFYELGRVLKREGIIDK